MNRRAYTEHRVRGSLEHTVGDSPLGESEIRAMAAKALDMGIVVFLRSDLAKLPEVSRRLIETEARQLYGQRGDR